MPVLLFSYNRFSIRTLHFMIISDPAYPVLISEEETLAVFLDGEYCWSTLDTELIKWPTIAERILCSQLHNYKPSLPIMKSFLLAFYPCLDYHRMVASLWLAEFKSAWSNMIGSFKFVVYYYYQLILSVPGSLYMWSEWWIFYSNFWIWIHINFSFLMCEQCWELSSLTGVWFCWQCLNSGIHWLCVLLTPQRWILSLLMLG